MALKLRKARCRATATGERGALFHFYEVGQNIVVIAPSYDYCE